VTLEGLDVPGYPFPRLHFDILEATEEGPGLFLAVERGEGGDDDTAALDEAGRGPRENGGEAASAVGDEGDVEHERSLLPAAGCAGHSV